MMSPSSDNKNIGSSPQHSPTHNNYQTSEESHLRTLWIGDLDGYMDETFVYSLFAHTNEVAQIKVIRDKGTGLGSGYGFVEFNNNDIAKYVLDTHNGKPLPIGNGNLSLSLSLSLPPPLPFLLSLFSFSLITPPPFPFSFSSLPPSSPFLLFIPSIKNYYQNMAQEKKRN